MKKPMSDPDERKRSTTEDELIVDWDDFEAMTDRVLALPPQPDEAGSDAG